MHLGPKKQQGWAGGPSEPVLSAIGHWAARTPRCQSARSPACPPCGPMHPPGARAGTGSPPRPPPHAHTRSRAHGAGGRSRKEARSESEQPLVKEKDMHRLGIYAGGNGLARARHIPGSGRALWPAGESPRQAVICLRKASLRPYGDQAPSLSPGSGHSRLFKPGSGEPRAGQSPRRLKTPARQWPSPAARLELIPEPEGPLAFEPFLPLLPQPFPSSLERARDPAAGPGSGWPWPEPEPQRQNLQMTAWEAFRPRGW